MAQTFSEWHRGNGGGSYADYENYLQKLAERAQHGDDGPAAATFKVSVTYGDGEPQVTEELTASQANQGMGAFLRDMLGLEDSAITRLVIERGLQ